ncbi:MAG: c-type cytochrome [Alphaproteobacteria bacterium]|nr:c-type cytochrome [Alphaproteobacteria bacterium]
MVRIAYMAAAITIPPLASIAWRGFSLLNAFVALIWLAALLAFFFFAVAYGILLHGLATLFAFVIILRHRRPGNEDHKFTPRRLIDYAIGLYLILSTSLTGSLLWYGINAPNGEPADNAAVERGSKIFVTSCHACHGTNNELAPSLDGIVGKEVAANPSFDYSAALRGKEGVWTENTLSRFLLAPDQFSPGTKMAISPLTADEARDVIAFLRSGR